MHEQDRAQVCDPFHALTQNRFVACGELIDAARAHEGFESHDAAPDERLHLVEVATKSRALAFLDRDARTLAPARGDKRPAANDQLFASSSMNRFTTSMATATSAALTDSAGL